MISWKWFSAVVLLFFAASLLGQEAKFNDKLEGWAIQRTDSIWHHQVRLRKIEGDSLHFSWSGVSQWIAVDSVLKIVQVRRSKFWQGAGAGLLLGGVVGGTIGMLSYKEQDGEIEFGRGFSGFCGAVLGGTSGFLAGGIIGYGSRKDRVYDLAGLSLEQKKRVLQEVLAL